MGIMTHKQVEDQMVMMMLYNIQSIYKNKSSDEYKMAGNIEKSPEYKSIEKMITDLKTLKGYPKNEAENISNMFATLHKPAFKECVESFIHKPDERNSLYTAMFTVGYRVLVGELARVYTSTEATDKGIEYKPSKIIRRSDIAAFIKSYDKDLNKRIDEYIRDKNAVKGAKGYTESETINLDNEEVYQEGVAEVVGFASGVIDGVIAIFGGILNPIMGALNLLFRGFKEVNPVSFINAVLMNSYQKNVDAFHDTVKAYESAKEAYEDYMKLPESKRKPEVEEKYKLMIEKYNIAVEDLRARIKDYDKRSQVERDRQEQQFPTVNVDKINKKKKDNSKEDSKEDTSSSKESNDDISF